MILIDEADRLDLSRLLDWVVFRQGVECGFLGRTNKLVDGCYSFWQGGVLALMQKILSSVDNESKQASVDEKNSPTSENHDSGSDGYKSDHIDSGKYSDIGFDFTKKRINLGPFFNSCALQQYVLLCSQVLEGGFKDKPGKHRDHYHTCYCLSGLSVSQYSWSEDESTPVLPKAVLGPYSNLLEPVHPLYNVVLDKYYEAHHFFS